MPYLNNNTIATKLHGVTEDYLNGSIQEVLQRIAAEPTTVRNTRLIHHSLYVRFIGGALLYKLGDIKEEYHQDLQRRRLNGPPSITITGYGARYLGCNVLIEFKPIKHGVPERA